jgi:hypothetical protein
VQLGDWILVDEPGEPPWVARIIGFDAHDPVRTWAVQPACPDRGGGSPPGHDRSLDHVEWHPQAKPEPVWWVYTDQPHRPATPEEVAAHQLATGQAGGL